MDTKDSLTNHKLSKPEIAALMRGSKLGFLLAASNFPEKLKDELAVLVGKMTLKQQERLLDVLEAKYLDEKTSNVEKKLVNDLKPLVKKYTIEDKARAKKLAAALNKI